MREILFRGKRFDSDDWVEGGILHLPDYSAICAYSDYHGWHEFIDVIPETVGQYTGLTDKNGKKIFEGDIVSVNTKPDSLEHGYKCNRLVVRFDEYHRFVASGRLEYPLCNHYEWEVIGNIHDNLELLEVSDA